MLVFEFASAQNQERAGERLWTLAGTGARSVEPRGEQRQDGGLHSQGAARPRGAGGNGL